MSYMQTHPTLHQPHSRVGHIQSWLLPSLPFAQAASPAWNDPSPIFASHLTSMHFFSNAGFQCYNAYERFPRPQLLSSFAGGSQHSEPFFSAEWALSKLGLQFIFTSSLSDNEQWTADIRCLQVLVLSAYMKSSPTKGDSCTHWLQSGNKKAFPEQLLTADFISCSVEGSSHCVLFVCLFPPNRVSLC